MKIVSTQIVVLLITVFFGTAYVSGSEPVDWTVLFYMDGDNLLEGWAVRDFYELAEVGSTDDINVVVQLDRFDGYSESDGNWTDCKRFLVSPGMTPTSENALASLGEINMGNPQNLEDFVIWAIERYPAEKYALVLRCGGLTADGAHGWLTVIGSDSSHDYDWLTSSEIRAALRQVTAVTGSAIDVISFHSCMGASIEMAYQISDGAEIMVASEEVTSPLCGYAYGSVIARLAAFPTMDAAELALVIHSQYVAENEGHDSEIFTLSVLNTTKIANEVVPAVNNLATNLNRILPIYCHEVLNTINEAATGSIDASWRDLYDFCQIVTTNIPDIDTVEAAQAVMNSLADVCLAEWHDVNSPDLHGLSIYLPPDNDPAHQCTWYPASAGYWRANTGWDEFLEALFTTIYPGTLDSESFDQVFYTLVDSDSDESLDMINVRASAITSKSSGNVSLLGQLINSSGSVVDMDTTSWTITGENVEWGNLYLRLPRGSEEDWYDVALFLYDDCGILEDVHECLNYVFLPQIMQHDVSVNNLVSSPMIIGQGFPVEINITICNLGHYSENATIITTINGTIIDTTQLLLQASNTTSYAITLETYAQTFGNYTVTTHIEPVNGEVNTDDNTLTGGVVCITIPGDVDGNKEVDVFDIVPLVNAYGSVEGHPIYIPSYDIDGDGEVGILDIVIAAGNYGESI